MSASQVPVALFRVGRIVATPNALDKLTQQDILTAIRRHQAGDWGDVCEDDRNDNDRALTECTRLVSVYHNENQVKFWVITEADRSATTVLMPEDY